MNGWECLGGCNDGVPAWLEAFVVVVDFFPVVKGLSGFLLFGLVGCEAAEHADDAGFHEQYRVKDGAFLDFDFVAAFAEPGGGGDVHDSNLEW